MSICSFMRRIIQKYICRRLVRAAIQHVKDKYRVGVVFRTLYEAMRPVGETQIYMPRHVCHQVGKSRQTVRKYACDPDSKHFRPPPMSVMGKMRQRIMHEDVHRPSTLRNLGMDCGYQVGQFTLSDYAAALDLGEPGDFDASSGRRQRRRLFPDRRFRSRNTPVGA